VAELFDLEAGLRALTGRNAAEHSHQKSAIRGAVESLGLGAATDQTGGIQLALSGSGLRVHQRSRPVPLDYIGVYITRPNTPAASTWGCHLTTRPTL
jgi:hypothetical protein